MRKIMVLLTVFVMAFMLINLNAQAWLMEFKDQKALDLDTWTPVGGTWDVNDGLLEGITAGYEDLMLDLDGASAWTDYTFEVKGKLTASRVWGVCFRYVDTTTNYRINLYEDLDATDNFYVYKRVSGAFSEVMKVGVGEIKMNEWYTIRLTVKGKSITVYLDDDLKIEVDDASGVIEEGGIALQGETGTNFQVEYVQIDGAGIPPTAVDTKGKLATLWSAVKN